MFLIPFLSQSKHQNLLQQSSHQNQCFIRYVVYSYQVKNNFMFLFNIMFFYLWEKEYNCCHPQCFLFVSTGCVLPDRRCDQGNRWGRWEAILRSDPRFCAGPVLWKECSADLVDPHSGQPKGPVWSRDVHCWWGILRFRFLKMLVVYRKLRIACSVSGPEEDLPRKMEYLEFVCHAPSEYFKSRSSPFPTIPIRPEKGYIWSHIGPTPALTVKESVSGSS